MDLALLFLMKCVFSPNALYFRIFTLTVYSFLCAATVSFAMTSTVISSVGSVLMSSAEIINWITRKNTMKNKEQRSVGSQRKSYICVTVIQEEWREKTGKYNVEEITPEILQN